MIHQSRGKIAAKNAWQKREKKKKEETKTKQKQKTCIARRRKNIKVKNKNAVKDKKHALHGDGNVGVKKVMSVSVQSAAVGKDQ